MYCVIVQICTIRRAPDFPQRHVQIGLKHKILLSPCQVCYKGAHNVKPFIKYHTHCRHCFPRFGGKGIHLSAMTNTLVCLQDARKWYLMPLSVHKLHNSLQYIYLKLKATRISLLLRLNHSMSRTL